MDDPIEGEVRAALERRAASMPAAAVERLRAVDYLGAVDERRSAAGWRGRFLGGGARPRLALGTAIAVVAAIALTATSLVTRPSPVFAGWTAAPRTADASAAAAADATCRGWIAALPATPGAPASGGLPAGLQVALTDARGPFTWVLYTSDGGHVSCLLGPDLVAVSVESANGSAGSISVGGPSSGGATLGGTLSGTAGQVVGPGPVSVGSGGTQAGGGSAPQMVGGPVGAGTSGTGSVSISGGPDGRSATALHLSTSDGKAYTVAEGSAGEGVTAVTLVLADGSRVEATVANGLYAAWWPGSQDATAMTITDRNGTTTQALPAPPVPGPGGAALPCPSGGECSTVTAP